MAGNNSTVGLETVTFTDNMSFDGTERGGAMTTDGELWIGSTAPRHVQKGSITSPGGSITVGYSSPNITIDMAGGGSGIEQVTIDNSSVPGTNPVLPLAGNITITGAQVAASSLANVIQTNSTAANSFAVTIQRTSAVAAADSSQNGVSHFDSDAFDVDANGFVQLNGGGIAATSFDVQANTAPGTDPVVPTAAGAVTVNGAAVANHSVVLETRSRAANAYNLEVQYSAAAAATDATKSGVAHFDSTSFAVDANGFVTLAGGGEAIDSIGVQTGTSPIVPTAGGLVTINGAVVAAGTNPVRSDGTGANTMALEVQISQAIAATDATKIGLSNFNSSQFSVDANGFVSISGGGGLVWNDVTGTSSAMAVNNGYMANNVGLVTLTLPATAVQFSVIAICGKGAGGWSVAQNANQQILVGSASSTVGATGSVASTNARDTLYLLATTGGASTVWTALNFVGNLTVT